MEAATFEAVAEAGEAWLLVPTFKAEATVVVEVVFRLSLFTEFIQFFIFLSPFFSYLFETKSTQHICLEANLRRPYHTQ